MRITSALFVAALLHSTAVLAADPEIINAPSSDVDPARFGWTGGYVGMSAGYAWLRDVDRQFTPALHDKGQDWIAGVHAGYLFGAGNFVAGAEVEANRLDINYELFNFIKITESVAVKAKVGYAWNRFLFTGHAGGAYVGTNVGLEDWGMVYGAGIDFALTDQFTVGGQYSRFAFKRFDNTLIDAKIDLLTARVGVKF